MSRFLLVPDKLDTSKCVLVPEDLDMTKAKEIQLPANLLVPGTSIDSLTTKKELTPLEGKNISIDLIYATKNVVLAKKLALFFNTHGFHVDNNGQLIYQGKRYSVDLEENFIDLVDGLKQPPRGYKTLYKLLKEVGLDYISDHRMKYY